MQNLHVHLVSQCSNFGFDDDDHTVQMMVMFGRRGLQKNTNQEIHFLCFIYLLSQVISQLSVPYRLISFFWHQMTHNPFSIFSLSHYKPPLESLLVFICWTHSHLVFNSAARHSAAEHAKACWPVFIAWGAPINCTNFTQLD